MRSMHSWKVFCEQWNTMPGSGPRRWLLYASGGGGSPAVGGVEGARE